MIGSDGLQHRSSWPVNNSIPIPPSYLSSMSTDIGPYSLTASGYPLQHSTDGMVGFLTEIFYIYSYILFVLKRDVKLQLTNYSYIYVRHLWRVLFICQQDN